MEEKMELVDKIIFSAQFLPENYNTTEFDEED